MDSTLVRKMLVLTCFLLAASALATDDIPNQSEAIDYNDDLSVPVKPSGHIVFNFQQIRFDQPPQVEVRDEEVAKYLYRPKTTPAVQDATTTIPVQEINMDFLPFNKVQAQKRYPSVDIWRPQTTTTTFRPIPPQFPENVQVPVVQDLYNLQWNSQPLYVQNPTYQNIPQSTIAPAPTAQIVEEQTQPTTSTTLAPIVVLPTTSKRPVTNKWQNHHESNRGHHKFSWDEVTLPPAPHQRRLEPKTSYVPTTTVAPTTRAVYGPRSYPGGAPPAPPTLTPWNGDDLGK